MMLAMTERLQDALAGIDGVVESDSAFQEGLACWVNGTEIAHFEGEHAIDIRLSRGQIRARRDQLRADPRAILRSSSSDWLTVEFRSAADEDVVFELVRAAAAAHRPADGAPARLPPTGRSLARRKRFH
jgi:Family of unknown function (DUF5519)